MDRGNLRRFGIRGLAVLAVCGALVSLFAHASPSLFGEEGPEPGPAPPRPHRRSLIVFVLDASASMRIRDVETGSGTISRIDAAVREIEDTLEGLTGKGEIRFDVVVCAHHIEVLSASLGRKGPLPLAEGTKASAKSFLSGRKGSGMTRMYASLSWALRICKGAAASVRPGTVILYTDGIPTFRRSGSGPKTVEAFFPAVRRLNREGVRINAFALSATSEGIAFLRQLCAENHGILFVPQ